LLVIQPKVEEGAKHLLYVEEMVAKVGGQGCSAVQIAQLIFIIPQYKVTMLWAVRLDLAQMAATVGKLKVVVSIIVA